MLAEFTSVFAPTLGRDLKGPRYLNVSKL
jgi:hypothetical protein